MKTISNLNALLELHEGRRRYVYDDATGERLRPGDTLKGNPTIGVGHNLEWGPFDEEMIDQLKREDMLRATHGLAVTLGKDTPPVGTPRWAALVDMVFTLGVNRFQKFVRMLSAIRNQNWAAASDELMNSRWAKEEAYHRASRDAEMLEKNLWPAV